MFERSGEKVKGISKVMFYMIAGIVVFVVLVSLAIAAGNSFFWGVFFMPTVFGGIILCILAWVSSVFLYAFGDLVDSNQRILEILMKGNVKEEVIGDKEDVNNNTNDIENNNDKILDEIK